jgi:pyruvate ferredoxin oxidoreductase alpha subunit
MGQRDTGWVQLYCSSAQEVLDSVLCAYRIAETVLLPVMVCAEGFLLSHTSEIVDVPDQAAVDGFVPGFRLPEGWVLDPDEPRVFSGLPEPDDYAAFQRNVAEAIRNAEGVIETVAADFSRHFLRPKTGALHVAGNPEADTALVTIGTIGDTAQELLVGDDDPLLVRVHAYRPFPARQLDSVLSRASHVCVVDRASAFGSFGPLGADVRSLRLAHAESVANIICGVGGTEVTPATLRWALNETRSNRGRVSLSPIDVSAEV